MATVRALTLEDRPGPVKNLKFTDILLDSVNVSWEPPQQPNGRIQGYIVNYRTYKLKAGDFQPFSRIFHLTGRTALLFTLCDRFM